VLPMCTLTIYTFTQHANATCVVKGLTIKLHSLAACIAVTYFLSAEIGLVAMTMGRQKPSTKGDLND